MKKKPSLPKQQMLKQQIKQQQSMLADSQQMLSDMVRVVGGLDRLEKVVQQQQRTLDEGRQLPGELVRTTIGIEQVEKAQHIFYKQMGVVLDGQSSLCNRMSRIESMLERTHLMVDKVVKPLLRNVKVANIPTKYRKQIEAMRKAAEKVDG